MKEKINGPIVYCYQEKDHGCRGGVRMGEESKLVYGDWRVYNDIFHSITFIVYKN